MARQLVFTSSPQGITPGRTGFCTVARHADLRERLVPVLESLSVYPPGWQPAPVICEFRLLDLAGAPIPVLTRIVDAGYDYTHRTNFLAHHLILDPGEMAGAPPPAEIFLRWSGWLNRWDEPPRWFGDAELVDLGSFAPADPPALPAATWKKLTGDAGRAALLVDGAGASPAAATRLLRYAPGHEEEMLALLRESSALLELAEAWRTEFTTCLQSSDNSSIFQWTALRAGSPGDTAPARPATLLDLTDLPSLPGAPVNRAARRAREGAATSLLGPAQRTPTLLAAPPPKMVGKRMSTVTAPPILVPRAPASAGKTTPLAREILIWAAVLGVLFLSAAGILAWMKSSRAVPAALPENSPAANSVVLPVPAPEPSTVAADNIPLFAQISQFADNGQFLEALACWRELAAKYPAVAGAQITFLNQRLVPGAVKDWRTRLAQISADMNNGKLDPGARQSLAARLGALKDFPDSWPTPDSPVLKQSWLDVFNQLDLIAQLPSDPTWIVNDLGRNGASQDYQDYTGMLNIQPLGALLRARDARFQISLAPAATLKLPPPSAWYNFNVQPEDFARNDYLILHDASRGAAGGRFLQFLVEGPNRVRLSWRQFATGSDFFAKYPANAPLRAVVESFWLHFVPEPPLSPFYLLVRRSGDDARSWKPLQLPVSWLTLTESPAQITFPSWLTQNLLLHAPQRQGFWLIPPGSALATAAAFVNHAQRPFNTLDTLKYRAQWLVDDLQAQLRAQQEDLERAQQNLADLNKLSTDPQPSQHPEQAVIDQAAATVKNLQAQVAETQASIQAASQPGWPAAAAPWNLVCGPDASQLSLLIVFTPNATGPSP